MLVQPSDGIGWTAVTCREAVQNKSYQDFVGVSTDMPTKNIHEPSLDGSIMEVAVCMACCVASRRLSGTQLGDFVQAFLHELSEVSLDLEPTAIHSLNDFREKIPFFSTVGCKWPTIVHEFALCSHFDRCNRSDSIDAESTRLGATITVEAKNREKFDRMALAEALARTPDRSNLHLIVVSELHQAYELPCNRPSGECWSKAVASKAGMATFDAMTSVLSRHKVLVIRPNKNKTQFEMTSFRKRGSSMLWDGTKTRYTKPTQQPLILILNVGRIGSAS